MDAGPFLESTGNFSGAESCFVLLSFIQDQSFNNFENNTMKLLVNDAKLTGLWARNLATIQQVLILTFAFGPVKFPGVSRNRPCSIPECFANFNVISDTNHVLTSTDM